VSAIVTDMVAVRVSQVTDDHPAAERRCSTSGSGRAESRRGAVACDGLLRIKISLSARIQMKNNRVRSRKNDVAQAAYAVAAGLLLDRVAITLPGYVAHGRFDMYGLR